MFLRITYFHFSLKYSANNFNSKLYKRHSTIFSCRIISTYNDPTKLLISWSWKIVKYNKNFKCKKISTNNLSSLDPHSKNQSYFQSLELHNQHRNIKRLPISSRLLVLMLLWNVIRIFILVYIEYICITRKICTKSQFSLFRVNDISIFS